MQRALLASVGFLMLASCGGDDAGLGSNASTTPSTNPTPTSASVTIATSSAPTAAPTDPVVEPGTTSPDVTASAPTGTVPDPCSLATKEEIAAALGGPVEDGLSAPGLAAGSLGCQWNGGQAISLRFASLEVRIGERATLDASFDQWHQYNDTEDVSGVGERAQWGSLTNTLDVIQGTTYFVVQVAGVQGDQLEAAKAIAVAVLARLE